MYVVFSLLSSDLVTENEKGEHLKSDQKNEKNRARRKYTYKVHSLQIVELMKSVVCTVVCAVVMI